MRETASVPVSEGTRPLALSRDTRWLAVAMLDEKVPIVRLLDAARLERPWLEVDEDRKPREAVTFAAFLDDAPTLLIGTIGGHFRIWGGAKGSADGVTLEPDEGGDFQRAFYSRTHELLIVHRREAEAVELWDLARRAVDRVAQRAAGRNLSRQEWQESPLSTVPFHKTFRDLPAMEIP